MLRDLLFIRTRFRDKLNRNIMNESVKGVPQTENLNSSKIAFYIMIVIIIVRIKYFFLFLKNFSLK